MHQSRSVPYFDSRRFRSTIQHRTSLDPLPSCDRVWAPDGHQIVFYQLVNRPTSLLGTLLVPPPRRWPRWSLLVVNWIDSFPRMSLTVGL